MKNYYLLFAFMLMPLMSVAQYNPYQDAYNYGRQMREQANQRLRNNPERLWVNIVENLGKGYAFKSCYDKALEDAEYLANEHNDGRGYLIMGYMYEMGIGSLTQDRDYAKKCYKWGMECGNRQCKAELNRIENRQYYRSSDAENFKRYYANLTASAYSASKSLDWNNSSSGSSSSKQHSQSSRCRSCNGTGVNPIANTGGSRTNWVAYYNSKGNKCKYCGRYTSHYHDRCASCNVPRH